jgi:hypothetical protein
MGSCPIGKDAGACYSGVARHRYLQEAAASSLHHGTWQVFHLRPIAAWAEEHVAHMLWQSQHPAENVRAPVSLKILNAQEHHCVHSSVATGLAWQNQNKCLHLHRCAKHANCVLPQCSLGSKFASHFVLKNSRSCEVQQGLLQLDLNLS